MNALLGMFTSVFSRKEGAKDHEAIRKTYFFASKISICIASFVAFGMIAWGKPFIARWMGVQYLDAYPVLVALVVGYYLALAQGPAVGLLFGLSRHKYFALVNSVEGIVNLLLSILLVRRYGIVGVALGTLVPMTLSSVIIQPIYVCRMAGIDYFEYVRRTGRTLAIVVGSLVLPVLLSVRFAVPDYIILLSVALVSLGLYVMPLWLLEFSPVETRILLGAVWPQLAMKRAAD
jgi:O-antigen/teichoic acid export membrane protein